MTRVKLFLMGLAGIVLIAQAAWAQPNGKELYEAMLFQDVPKMNALIAQGADVNHKENGRPILVWAAQSGNVEIVKILIGAKADVNAIDEGLGQSPLMRAIETQQVETVAVLLEAKADPNAKAANGETVLEMAVGSAKPEIVEAVIKAGADVK